ncbi:MAG: hypothetical protein AABN33_18495 [Acidobacteriota bacterium]
MKAKRNVNLKGCSFELGYAAAILEGIYRDAGAELVVTSAKDGTHGPRSLHPKGDALDGRTRQLTRAQGNRILATAKAELEPLGFDVIDERAKPTAPHFHIEFQPKAGESFVTIEE